MSVVLAARTATPTRAPTTTATPIGSSPSSCPRSVADVCRAGCPSMRGHMGRPDGFSRMDWL